MLTLHFINNKRTMHKHIAFILFAILMLLPSVSSDAQSKQSTDDGFAISTIDDATFLRMQKGGSYPTGCTVPRSSLRYLQVLHYDFEGNVQTGELVCNKAIADDLLAIFRELYEAHYQIERISLIDDYGADDESSMRANNTSCFCYRTTAGSKNLSKHALGMAIDINPLQNPYVKTLANGKTRIQPTTAGKYVKRTPRQKHMIDRSDLCYQLFIKHGFRWGGTWRTLKDYQHFEK